MQEADVYYIYYPLALLILGAVVAAILDVRWVKRYLTPIFVLGWVVFVLKMGVESRNADDFQVFWQAGQAIWQWKNPYEDLRLLNPPTALPLYALLGLLPYRAALFVWKLFSAAIAVALVLFSYRMLQAQEHLVSLKLPGFILQGLSIIVALSLPSHTTLRLGQTSLIVALCVVFALYAHQRGKQILAGVVLAIATIKIHTALPFLMLWIQGKNWRAGITFIISVIALSLAVPGPLNLLEWTSRNFDNIALLSQPGAINDYSNQAPVQTAASIISFESLGYQLGLENRNILKVFQVASVGLLGLWLLRTMLLQRWSGGFACAVLTLYSMLFMYHRNYDTVILTIPLVYVVAQIRVTQGRERCYWVATMACILGILYWSIYFNIAIVRLFERLNIDLLTHLANALFLPLYVWLLLAAIGFIYQANRLKRHPTSLKSS